MTSSPQIAETEKQSVLYLPSTPLNILICAAHAYQFRNEQQAVMLIIDQKQTSEHPYLNSLLAWKDSPFISVDVLPGKAKGFSKLKQRKANFFVINQIITQYQFDVIATGSDRRIEFQYAMHKASALKTVKGWYMDDGLYSYVGRASKGWKDSVSALLKKITYGRWWKEPATVGASDWIDESFLFAPCQADIRLKKKHINKIETHWFQNSAINELTQQVLNHTGLHREGLLKLKKADLCILIPHPHNISKIENYTERLQQLLNWASQKNLNTVIKYHPRTEGKDALRLKQQFQLEIIPAEIAFEFVLTQFSNHVKIIGDVGTALLTAKWLRSNVKTMALLTGNNILEKQMSALLIQHGVSVKTSFEDLQKEIEA